MKPTYRYKFLRKGMKSANGNLRAWKLNQWRKHEGQVSLCSAGFHCSVGAYQAFSYVHGGILARVEVRGESEIDNTKEVYSEMRVVQAWKWTKADSVALAIYAAELVIKLFEQKYPDDKRPRKAIQAAKAWLKNPTEENRKKASSAAYYAAYAASSAAYSAAYYAAAAKEELYAKLDKWMERRISKLEQIT